MKETKTIYETVANIKRFSIERLTSKLVMVGYKGPKVTNLIQQMLYLQNIFDLRQIGLKRWDSYLRHSMPDSD